MRGHTGLAGGVTMLDAFYTAFSPACFALLGLWLVAVQIRMPQWQGNGPYQRTSYSVALHFALPGIMSVLALVDPADPVFWRASFAVVALGGVVALAVVRGFPGRAGGGPPRLGGLPGAPARGPAAAQAGRAGYLAAIAGYLAIGVLAFIGGHAALRAEAILLTAMLLLGFHLAWLMMFEAPQPAPAGPEPTSAGR
jgi:hypothetical protein